MSLSRADRELIESTAYDPDAAVSFNEITACLVWSDEVPPGLSAEGYDIIRDLHAARGYIHRGVPHDRWDSRERWDRWNEAIVEGVRWNGFRRIALSSDERSLLERHRVDQSPI